MPSHRVVFPCDGADGARFASPRAVRCRCRVASDPGLRDRGSIDAVDRRVSWRTVLDSSPVAQIALALMRDATGREAPLEPLSPTRPVGLPVERAVAFWSLSAGVGAST